MFQKNRMLFVNMLLCFALAKPTQALEPVSCALVVFAGINVVLDAIGAPCAFKSKWELSPTEHEARRANMEGATATYALGAFFSALTIPMVLVPKLKPAAVPVFAIAMTTQAVAAGLSASTFGSDQHAPAHETYPYFNAAFGLGLAGLATHISAFLGAYWWQIRNN